MAPDDRRATDGGYDDYVPLEKRTVKTLGKGCFYLLIIPVAIFVLVLIGDLLKSAGQAGMGGAIFVIVSSILFLLGLFALLYDAPKRIIPEARQLGSTGRGLVYIIIGFFLAFFWAAIITIKNPSGLRPGITAGLLIQWAVIMFVSSVVSRVLWEKFKSTQLDRRRFVSVAKAKQDLGQRQPAPGENIAATDDRRNEPSRKEARQNPESAMSSGDWDFCENCGKPGAQLFTISSGTYTFCNGVCLDDFGNKLFAGGSSIFCPFCGKSQLVTNENLRVCRFCCGIMDDLQATEWVGSLLDEMIKTLSTADETLHQSNNPDDEIELAERLLQYPEDAVRAIELRGWKKRGTAEEGTRFMIRVLARIVDEGEGVTREKALNSLVGMFETPDDHTTGWQNMLEQAASSIAKCHPAGAEEKLLSLKEDACGRNLQAIDYALNLLKSAPGLGKPG